jgi:hypothetical protein
MLRATTVAALLVLFAQTALAQTRVVVLSFDGPAAGKVRAAVVDALDEAKDFDIVKTKDATHASKALDADLSMASGRVVIATELSISAFIEGTASKRGSSTQVILRVYNGRDGKLIGETKLSAGAGKDALPREVQKKFMSELGPALARCQRPDAQAEPPPPPQVAAVKPAVKPAAPKAAPKPVAKVEKPPPVEIERPEPAPVAEAEAERPPEPEPAEPEAEPEPEGTSGPKHALELGANVRVLTRSYSYTDALLKLGVHSLDPTPAFRLEARWYPGAHFTHSFAANLGLDLHGQMLWPVDATKGSESFKTSGFAFGIAARLRIPLPEHELGAFIGYGGQSLGLADSHGVDPGVPSVKYGFVRLGADARFALPAHLTLGARLAYLLLTGYGELGQAAWFSHVGGGGIEAELSISYELSPLVVLSAGGGLSRYFMSLKPQPTDVGAAMYGRVAGGISDTYPFGTLGVTLRP